MAFLPIKKSDAYEYLYSTVRASPIGGGAAR
jgi:hypothetical protein